MHTQSTLTTFTHDPPALFNDMMQLGFQACETVNPNRRGISQQFKTIKLAKGEIYSKQIDDDAMLCLKWKDKHEVCMLSTFHDESCTSRKRQTKHSVDGTEVMKKPKLVEATTSIWEAWINQTSSYYTVALHIGG